MYNPIDWSRLDDRLIRDLAEVMVARVAPLPNRQEFQFRLSHTTNRLLDERWLVRIDTTSMPPAKWKPLESFLDSIQSVAGRFSMWLPDEEVPHGPGSGIGGPRPIGLAFSDGTTWSDGTAAFGPGVTHGAVAGASRRGSDLVRLGGLVPSHNAVLRAGDRFSIRHGPAEIPCLYKVVQEAARSDAGGAANVRIAPRLRWHTAVTDVVDFYRPRALFQLMEQPELTLSGLLEARATLDLVEVGPDVIAQTYGG